MTAATYPEPPDGSIVGWGHPITTAFVRLDEAARVAGWNNGDRWFTADDSDGAPDPVSWDALLRQNARAGAPYLLTPTPIEATP